LVEEGIGGHTILVTGGGGSIGSELCRQLARWEPAKLVVIDRSELNLFLVERELEAKFPNLDKVFQLADVADAGAMDTWVGHYRPDFVFHAAAYKHVPLLEGQIREAVRNNVLGTWNVASAADRHNVGTFVFISTDKAVTPANVMGATKRIGELLCEAWNRQSRTAYLAVRFGNVLGSAGSVVEVFKEQIERGGPVTVTHPDAVRYFMTISEACQLIMEAGVVGEGGEIFVLDMGEPVRIRDLAEQMIRLSGKIPDHDIEIAFTGLRPGEKLAENLFYEGEDLASTHHDKLFLTRTAPAEWARAKQSVEAMHKAVLAFDEEELTARIQTLVPTFRGEVAQDKEVARERETAKVVPIDQPLRDSH
jgi:FlaA1/EpsC-like NDP-sugar epimerase